MSVREYLQRLLEVHDAHNAIYKNDFDLMGDSFMAMFPAGLHLSSPSAFARFAIFAQIHGKMLRYAQQFENGGHSDSLDDAAVYSMILRHLDEEYSNVRSIKVHEERVEEAKTSHSRGIHKVKNKTRR